MFERFPYTNLHELNLDWILSELKKIESAAVLSVNGQTGDVILYQENGIRFPDVTEDQWNIRRQIETGAAGQKIVGLQFLSGKMQRIDGTGRYDVYDAGNPPDYPVESVNGQTGAVVLSFPVTSVNGQTGGVILYQQAGIRYPDATDQYWNIRRQIKDSQDNNVIEGLQFNAGSAMQRISGANRYTVYDSQNQPPYPVTSVNGETGAVQLTIPAAFVSNPTQAIMHVLQTVLTAKTWGLDREIVLGDTQTTAKVGIYFETATDGTPSAYIRVDDGQTQTTIKLLTNDDIPSSAGVASVNGLTGAVTLTGEDIEMASDDNRTIEEVISGLEENVTDLYTADGDMADNFSDEYNTTASYAVGDLVIYQNKLYKNLTAIVGGETWNPAHWHRTTISDQIAVQAFTDITLESEYYFLYNYSFVMQNKLFIICQIGKTSGTMSNAWITLGTLGNSVIAPTSSIQSAGTANATNGTARIEINTNKQILAQTSATNVSAISINMIIPIA